MATVTPNFNWPVPTSTDLVRDGATAIEALGDSIDASLVDLKGGTTGQVLSKTSNTDMDFTWVAQDDSNAIQNTIVDAKGDLIAASASDTPARLAVGANGETLVADSSTSTGLRYTGNYAAGKNAIINGAFNVWQRGTSFSNPAQGSYFSDRWQYFYADANPTTYSVSQQAFTPGAAPVAGYESQYFTRSTITTVGSNTAFDILSQKIENVQTFAGQTVTLSFWAKADSARSLYLYNIQNFGSGGSSAVYPSNTTVSLTSSWQRFTWTIAIPSISGKTVGTSSYLQFVLRQASASGSVLDVWGVQLEAGSVATAFQTATGTIQGELAAAMRYFQKTNNQSEVPGAAPTATPINAVNTSTTFVAGVPPFKGVMRVAPTITLYSTVTGTTGRIRSGGADVVASVGDVGEYAIGYISATGLTAGSNSSIAFAASAEL